jgi:hypothetical protein
MVIETLGIEEPTIRDLVRLEPTLSGQCAHALGVDAQSSLINR